MRIFIAFALLGVVYTRRKFNGDKVYRITPQNDEQLELVRRLVDHFGSKISVWKDPRIVGRYSDIHVNKHNTEAVEDHLSRNAISFRVMIDDVQQLIDEQEKSSSGTNCFRYDKYNDWENILAELHNLAENNERASTFHVGNTYEGRKMIGVKVSNNDGKNKSAIWIDGGIHAREWIAPATVMYFLNLTVKSDSDQVLEALAKFDFYFLPVFNIDGYVYTHTTDRMWRKTRRPITEECYGVDPNRNWDSHWGGEGTSDDPCSETYRGEEAFSEIEVSNVADYLAKIPGLVSYFNIHSYSQMLLTPWSYTNASLPPDFREITRVGTVFVDEIAKRYNTQYSQGPPAFLLSPAAGGSCDYTYEELGLIYSYGIELRDTGEYGFLLPEYEIIPSGEETSDALLAAAMTMNTSYVPCK